MNIENPFIDAASPLLPKPARSRPSSLTANSSSPDQVNEGIWSRIWKPLGFKKAYNRNLFLILAGWMLAFCITHVPYLDFSWFLPMILIPGEWFYFRRGAVHIFLLVHLAAVIPAGFMMIPQFIPRIRQQYLLFHRINGYTIVLLSLVGAVTGILIARHAFSGDLAGQSASGMLGILTIIGISMAVYNVRRLQIEQHRAWMLRTMVWMGSIILTRVILPFQAFITTALGGFYLALPCKELSFLFPGRPDLMQSRYPQCSAVNGTNDGWIAVKSHFDPHRPDGIGASFDMGFGMALWLSLFIHVVGVEIYLALTPRETARLRVVSYEKQLAAGYKNPGNEGTVVQKWGDAEAWMPPPFRTPTAEARLSYDDHNF